MLLFVSSSLPKISSLSWFWASRALSLFSVTENKNEQKSKDKQKRKKKKFRKEPSALNSSLISLSSLLSASKAASWAFLSKRQICEKNFEEMVGKYKYYWAFLLSWKTELLSCPPQSSSPCRRRRSWAPRSSRRAPPSSQRPETRDLKHRKNWECVWCQSSVNPVLNCTISPLEYKI